MKCYNAIMLSDGNMPISIELCRYFKDMDIVVYLSAIISTSVHHNSDWVEYKYRDVEYTLGMSKKRQMKACKELEAQGIISSDIKYMPTRKLIKVNSDKVLEILNK